MSRTDTRTGLLWPSLIAGAIFAVLVGLGAWQVLRLEWKTALIENAETRLALPAVSLATATADWATIDFRRVAVTGRFASDGVLYKAGGSPAGRAGLRVLAAFLDVHADEPILVDIGWIPIDAKAAGLDLPDGTLTVEGVLRTLERPNWLTADNDPARNAWYWIDTDVMARALDLSSLAPVLLRAERIAAVGGAQILPDGPERGAISAELRNDHLSYAITWFALAAGLIAIYLLFIQSHRRARRPNQQ